VGGGAPAYRREAHEALTRIGACVVARVVTLSQFPRMRRSGFWSQLVIAWLPIWAFFTLSILVLHPGTPLDTGASAALRLIVTALGLGAIAYSIIGRYPWPSPLRASSLALHAAFALVFAAAWVAANAGIDAVTHARRPVGFGPGLGPYIIVGVWVYSMIAGASYAAHARARTALAEANAARAQLSALRSQLNPHFLFNALHTVVQLIPVEPARASQAAEQISDLLRMAIDEERDLIPLDEELRFVQRYLGMERLRFADRLDVRVDVAPAASALLVPSFGVHCLVENAVRHGVENTIGPTTIAVSATTDATSLILTVRDSGEAFGTAGKGDGTGLARLRERVAVLFGQQASLTSGAVASGGYEARLVLPARTDDA
jgi:two-component system, LytTR family, sensor kinase